LGVQHAHDDSQGIGAQGAPGGLVTGGPDSRAGFVDHDVWLWVSAVARDSSRSEGPADLCAEGPGEARGLVLPHEIMRNTHFVHDVLGLDERGQEPVVGWRPQEGVQP